MKSISSTTTLMVALAAPLTVLAQRGNSGGNQGDVYDYTTVIMEAPVVTVTAGQSPPSTQQAITTASPAVASPVVASPVVSSSVAPASSAVISSAVPSASGGSTTSPSSCSGSGMNIAWTGDSVSMSWSGGSGTTTGCTNLGTDFNGQVAIGGTGGTIFEGNYNGGSMFFDVSFIIGYSVPMLCSSSAGKSGCSIDLAKQGNACPQQSGSICTNPVGPNGNKTPGSYAGDMSSVPWCYACSAPDPFFQPCAGSGYTYPYDDGATQSASGTITCCIGTSCGTTGREGSTKDGHAEPTRSSEPCDLCPSGGSKRGLDEVFSQYEKEARALSPSLLPRRHKRSGHRHAHVHEGKAVQ